MTIWGLYKILLLYTGKNRNSFYGDDFVFFSTKSSEVTLAQVAAKKKNGWLNADIVSHVSATLTL